MPTITMVANTGFLIETRVIHMCSSPSAVNAGVSRRCCFALPAPPEPPPAAPILEIVEAAQPGSECPTGAQS